MDGWSDQVRSLMGWFFYVGSLIRLMVLLGVCPHGICQAVTIYSDVEYIRFLHLQKHLIIINNKVDLYSKRQAQSVYSKKMHVQTY